MCDRASLINVTIEIGSHTIINRSTDKSVKDIVVVNSCNPIEAATADFAVTLASNGFQVRKPLIDKTSREAVLLLKFRG